MNKIYFNQHLMKMISLKQYIRFIKTFRSEIELNTTRNKIEPEAATALMSV